MENADKPIRIMTEDQVWVSKGDAAYDYYSMEPGVIETEPDSAGWFDFRHTNGDKVLLNGQRICSKEYAAKRGFPKADAS